MAQDPRDTVRQFIAHINSHDVNSLVALMTEDHVFTDSLGASVQGRNEMRNAWIAYFLMIPDYTIAIDEIFVEKERVAMLGRATGTYSEDGKLSAANRWEMPLALRAVVRNGRIADWQVYADNEPVRALMRKT